MVSAVAKGLVKTQKIERDRTVSAVAKAKA
jgi:hypothetical protein